MTGIIIAKLRFFRARHSIAIQEEAFHSALGG
jgi:hypothetical protein